MSSRIRPGLLVAVALLATTLVTASETALETEDQKTLYALGLAMAQNLKPFGMSPGEIDLIQAGLADGALGREPRVALEKYGPKIDGVLRARLAAVADQERAAGKLFLEEAARQEGAVTTDSGLIYVDETPGTGPSPEPSSTVKLHYHGTLRDGTVFDSSREVGKPASIALAQMPPCMKEGVASMSPGGKRKVYCPAELAYGDKGLPPMIPPAAVLVLDIELLEIVEPAAAEPVPAPAEPAEPTPIP